MSLTVTRINPLSPEASAIIRAHNDHCNAIGPEESCHNLTADQLNIPEITLWGAWLGSDLVGIGALKEIAPDRGEIKSMHTLAAARGLGAGRALMASILTEAEARGYASLWLETGTVDEFIPARRLYESLCFETCPPFGDYVLDPFSAFYSKTLAVQEVAQ